MAFNNLTVDFRKLSRIPVRDRAELLRAPQASDIFGNMTPSQIAKLVPSYYQNLASGVSTGAMSSAMSGGSGGGYRPSSGGSASPAPTVNRPPPRPGFIQDVLLQGADTPALSTGDLNLKDRRSLLKGTYDAFRRAGFSDQQSRALVAEVGRENSFRPGIMFGNHAEPGRLHQGRMNVGIFSMAGARKDGLVRYMQSQGLLNEDGVSFAAGQASLDAMARYAKMEMDGNPEAPLSPGQLKAAQRFLSDPTADQQNAGSNLAGWIAWDIAGRHHNAAESLRRRDMHRDEIDAVLSELPAEAVNPVTQTNPAGADNGAVIPLLKGDQSAETTATAVPAGEVAQRTMVLSLGTNDWDNSASTYQNVLDTINAAKEKGYKVVVVPPTGSNDKFKTVHNAVIQAATEAGATIEQPQEYGPDGYHPTANEYKRIGEKYAGAVVVGDSIANGIGQHVEGGKTVAKDGLNSSVIRTNVLSDDVPQNAPVQVTPQTQTFNVQILEQMDPRIKQWYEKAPPEDRAKMEKAIMKLGAEGVNNIAKNHPSASPIAVGDAVGGLYSNVVEKQGQVAGVRRGAIKEELKESLSYAADQAGNDQYKVEIDVTSGGQRMEGAPGAKGSHRHDDGGAGDFNAYLVNRETGERILLDPRNQEHIPYISKMTTAFSRVHPDAGVGALYMDDPTKIHFGGDDVSEHGGHARGPLAYEGPDWFKQAHAQGVAQQQQDAKDGYNAKAEWRQKKIEAQSQQVVPTPPGTEPVTPTPQVDDTAPIDLKKAPTAAPAPSLAPADIPPIESQPNFKLGGVANLVDEQMSVKGADGKGFNFNANEEVNIKNGKATVQNEFKKKTEETRQKTDNPMPKPVNQGAMRSSSSSSGFQQQAKHMIVPHSPSAQRHFEASRFNDKHFRGNGSRNMT
jgi:hypothetical protein